MPRTSRKRQIIRAGLAVLAVMSWGCERDTKNQGVAGDSGSTLATPTAAPPVALPARFMLGTPASAAQIAAIDIDANASGTGLPAGRGTYADGVMLYGARCASCHGPKGEGIAPFPPLVRAGADTSFGFGNDVRLVKSIGNYWPYATTLYDYIHRAMPFDAPGSLRPNEVYGLVAYLLAENRIIDQSAVMDAKSLRAVRMPARRRFVLDNRGGSTRVR